MAMTEWILFWKATFFHEFDVGRKSGMISE